MNLQMLNQFLLGMLVMACFAAGLFLLRFFRRTHDRLFLIFALAFWLLGVNWFALAFFVRDETLTWLYLIRLLAFVLILLGIYDKNRTRGD